MPYGWTDTNLEIDLTRGDIEKKEGDPKLIRDYLGGKGTNAKLLWDRVPPEVAPFSPDNLLIVGTGVLTGTIVPSANRGVITFRSPHTGLHMHSALGGFWPAELKHAGYDTIIIRGKSPTPVYLWIDDDKVEIRDASHLWGKGTHETQRLIQRELKNDKVQVACIGLAGENKVYAATIQSSIGASASRGGAGAIMGDKNLKAIAVYGTRDVSIAKPSKLIELCEDIRNKAGPLREVVGDYASNITPNDMLGGYYGNLNDLYRDMPRDSAFRKAIKGSPKLHKNLQDRVMTRQAGCYNCLAHCRQVYPCPDGGYSFIKCHSLWTFQVSCKILDFEFALDCYRLCDEYGLDVTFSRCIAFAIDLYEKGILTKEDTDGMHLEWGNKEVVLSLIHKIARREGIGDILANGVHEAARQIGKGAEEHAHHIKKLETVVAAPSAFYAPYFALTVAISDKQDGTRNISGLTQYPWLKALSREERQEGWGVKSGYFHYPKELEKHFLDGIDWTGHDYEGGCQFAIYDEEVFTITDTLGICNWWSGFVDYPPITTRAMTADLLSCVTGMDIDEVELTEIARRIINLVRACNVRFGVRRKDDTVPKIFFERSTSPPWRTLDRDVFNKWIDRFYELRGWNSEGIPSKETLEKLGLAYVRQDLEQRGVLTD